MHLLDQTLVRIVPIARRSHRAKEAIAVRFHLRNRSNYGEVAFEEISTCAASDETVLRIWHALPETSSASAALLMTTSFHFLPVMVRKYLASQHVA